jgi:hypothetical protein
VSRAVVISEEFGLYRIRNLATGLNATGGYLEKALTRAAQEAGVGEVEVHSLHDAAQIIESMLGEQRGGGGQIHEGLLAG